MGVNTYVVQSTIGAKSLATVLTYYDDNGVRIRGVSDLVRMAIQDYALVLIDNGLVRNVPSNEADEIYTDFLLYLSKKLNTNKIPKIKI